MTNKKETKPACLIDQEVVETKILLIRDKKVILDKDLAVLYGVETKQLKRQVRRNIKRFPKDFMFELTHEEYHHFLRCQTGTLKRGEYSKYLPYAFTEQGVAMLSSVLDTERAILVNIQIMRTFSKIREIIMTHKDLRQKIEDMENKYDQQFKVVFDAIRKLLLSPQKPRRKIGFHSD